MVVLLSWSLHLGSTLQPDNLMIGCVWQENASYVCLPVLSNARMCRFPLECATLFLILQPVDALLWQPLFQIEGNMTIHSEIEGFRAEISGADFSNPTNDSWVDALKWVPCETYKRCMYHYLDIMNEYDGVLFRANQ